MLIYVYSCIWLKTCKGSVCVYTQNSSHMLGVGKINSAYAAVFPTDVSI